ncbi:MAG: CoA-binding protein [Sulfolobales archaeon]
MVCELGQSYPEKLFKQKSIALVGASEKHGTIGRTIMENLLGKFKMENYPADVKYEVVFGLKCYKGVNELPKSPDLAVVAIPTASTPKAIKNFVSWGLEFL